MLAQRACHLPFSQGTGDATGSQPEGSHLDPKQKMCCIYDKHDFTNNERVDMQANHPAALCVYSQCHSGKGSCESPEVLNMESSFNNRLVAKAV